MTTNFDNSPQHVQMADPSMVRCLDAQSRATWPQEERLFERYELKPSSHVLDLGCGTGETLLKLKQRYPQTRMTGIDLVPAHLDMARIKLMGFTDVEFVQADIYEDDRIADDYDLILMRHLLQAVPDIPGLLQKSLQRLKPGGHVHVLAEDYGMIHAAPTKPDLDAFWRETAWPFAEGISNDLRSGRKMRYLLHEAGFGQIQVDYIRIDSFTTDADILRDIFSAWKDGYAEVLAQHSRYTHSETAACFDALLSVIDRPDGYLLWHIPLWTAVKP